MRFAYVVVLSLFFFASAVLAQNADLTGPIALRNDYPLDVIHLSFEPQSGNVLEDGVTTTSLTGAWSNTSIVSDDYIVDTESVDSMLEVHRGFGDGVELSAGLPLLWRGGGRLDHAIDDWHKFWGLPRRDRDKIKSNQFNIEGVTRDGDSFKVKDEGLSLGNFIIGGKFDLGHSACFSTALVSELSFPRFGGSYGHDGVDGLLGVASTAPLSWTTVHGGIAAVMFSNHEYEGIPYAPFHVEGFINSETRLAEWASLIIGMYGGTKTVEKISGYPDYFTYLDVGFRFPLGSASAFAVNVRENPTPHDGTSDISFVAAVERVWQ